MLIAKLPGFLARQRWFGGKARTIASIEILDAIPMRNERISAELVLAQVRYSDQHPEETYVVPVLAGDDASAPRRASFGGGRSEPRASSEDDELQDAMCDSSFLSLLLDAILQNRVFRTSLGALVARSTSAYDTARNAAASGLRPKALGGEQSNSSAVFGDRFILKLFRQAPEGITPELEIGSFLTERARFTHTPALAGSMVYEAPPGTRAVGILQAFVPNRGDAWTFTLQAVCDFLTEVDRAGRVPPALTPAERPMQLAQAEPSALAKRLAGAYLNNATLLGRRTAELHLALASDPADPGFAPEPFSERDCESLRRDVSDQASRMFELLRRRIAALPSSLRLRAQEVLSAAPELDQRLERFSQAPCGGARLRIHGDYHLGQVLCADEDFVIIDFEGEPARTLVERRRKQPALQDVAGMLRSFHYAAHKGVEDWLQRRQAAPGSPLDWKAWSRLWSRWACSQFLRGYFQTAEGAAFLPPSLAQTESLLNACLLNKAVYELDYELNHRPEWVGIPLEGILEILSDGSRPAATPVG